MDADGLNLIAEKEEINSILGMNLENKDVESTLKSLGFKYTTDENIYEVIVPNRRQDIVLQKEDIIEEVRMLMMACICMYLCLGKLPS